VDNVDEEVVVMDISEVLNRLRVLFSFVDDGPGVQPDVEGLFFPDLERLVVHNSRLNHFFVAEHSPSHCIHVVVLNVLVFFSCRVASLVADHVVFLQEFNQRL